jgi:urea transport system substrate-binding protein
MKVSEQPIADATLLAVEEINASGGVLGRMIEPIVADGASKTEIFAREAEKLLIEDRVEALFGTYTSASRREVKKVADAYQTLFFCPSPSEGVETAKNLILTGQTPNQQVFPALLWCAEHIGKRFFIVGSEEIFVAILADLIKTVLPLVACTLVGEEYVIMGSSDVLQAVQQIKQVRPDIIINMLYGSTNNVFFSALRAEGISSADIPTMSFTLAEPEIQNVGIALTAGDYASWSYFQSIASDENLKFVQAFKKRYGDHRVVDDSMETAYFSVYLWKQAVELAGTSDPTKVIHYMHNQSRVVPEGIVSIDPFNHAAWRACRIGQINNDGQFDIVWSSHKAVYPMPYLFKSHEEWDIIVQEQFTSWGGAWAKE